MEPLSKNQTLDRHAAVMAIWLAFGVVAIALLDYGFGAGGMQFILAAFGVILAAFVGHIIVNALYRTTFTQRELALGLVLYVAGLVAFGLATLLSAGFGARNFLPLSLGFVALGACLMFYMITHFGARRVFDAFDVIREFKAQGEGGNGSRRGDLR